MQNQPSKCRYQEKGVKLFVTWREKLRRIKKTTKEKFLLRVENCSYGLEVFALLCKDDFIL